MDVGRPLEIISALGLGTGAVWASAFTSLMGVSAQQPVKLTRGDAHSVDWQQGRVFPSKKLEAKANGLGPSPLSFLPCDEQAGTESPPSPSLAGMLVTLCVADFFGEAHCSETHEAVGG